MPRYVFPGGTIPNANGRNVTAQFFTSISAKNPSFELSAVSAGQPGDSIYNGIIVSDTLGVYSAFAGPEGIQSGYLKTNIGSTIRVTGSYGAGSGGYDAVQGLVAPFYIAHRGGGNDRPEHTLEAYEGAMRAGFQHIEVSVNLTQDNELICMHDATYDRTTNATGNINTRSWPELNKNYVVDYGPVWPGGSWQNLPIPKFRDVLESLSPRCTLWVEPKTATTAAVNVIFAMLARYPSARVVWKFASIGGTGGIPTHAKTAQTLGYPAWAYMNSGSESDAAIALTCQQADIIGVDAGYTDAYISKVVAQATLNGKMVVAYPVHRRSARDHLIALGVSGFMASSAVYVSTATPLITSSNYASGFTLSGDLPMNDLSGTAPTFDTANRALQIPAATPSNNSTLLGSLCPPKSGATSYTVTFAMRWPTSLPTSTNHSDFIICNTDDTQYQHQVTTNAGGYHLVIRTTGVCQLFKHDPGTTTGTGLGTAPTTTQPVIGTWMTFSIAVTPTTITWQRTDDASSAVIVTDSSYRGGYMHIACASSDANVQFRDIVVS